MRSSCSLFLASLGVALVTACDSSSPPEPTEPTPVRLDRSGSRLQARGYAADGIFVLEGLYDSELGLMCEPSITSDGTARCVPRDSIPLGPYADWEDGGPDYLDDGCSKPVVTIRKSSCSDPARVVVRSSRLNDRQAAAGYWRIGTPMTPTKLFRSNMGTCEETSVDPENSYFERGAPLASVGFVAFVRHEVPLSSAIRALVLEGEDGSRVQTQEFIDAIRGEPCEIAVAEDNVTRCTPVAAGIYQNRTFSDADCRTPAAAIACSLGPDACDQSTVTERIPGPLSDGCVPTRYRFYTAGAPVEGGAVHFGAGPTECAMPILQTTPFVEVGPPIAPTTFPAVVPGSLPSELRLVEETLGVDGAPMKQFSIFDPQLDDECRFEKAGDGKVRCLPAHAAVPSVRFADAACTIPLYSPVDVCEGATTTKYARIVEGSSCDPIVRIRAVSPATQAFERRDGISCVAASTEATFMIGDEIPPTTFVEGTPTTR